MVIHDLVDHNLVLERKAIGPAGRRDIGKLKRPGPIWRTALEAVFDRRCGDHGVAIGRDKVNAIARDRVEAELGFGDRQVLAGCENRAVECVLAAGRRSDDVTGQIHRGRAMINQLKPELRVGRGGRFIDC